LARGAQFWRRMARQDLLARAFAFAAAILDLHARISADGPAFAHMAQQLFKASSSIGAMLEEGAVANSRRDMAAKYAVALSPLCGSQREFCTRCGRVA
jgi:four helix bundle protein